LAEKLKQLLKAARADFLPASIVPFFVGTAYAVNRGFSLSLSRFVLGLTGIAAAHLSANLLNDYYDYRSGADNRTAKVSSFFGGSRAIQEGVFTDRQILGFSLLLMSVAVVCGAFIFVMTRDPVFLILMAAGGILAVEYTAPPLRLAYRRLGELDIFLLFGVGTVMGSFYLFSGRFDYGSFSISLPVAFLIAAVIICNEVPDFESDISAGKQNLLSLTGVKRGGILYGVVVCLSLLAIFLNVAKGILPFYAALIGIVYFPGVKAYSNLKNGFSDINRLIKASRFTVMQHSFVGIAIILMLLIS
jgi:1,4-dihydroxy-2-naphthoate octaprenyltransferase